MRALLAIGAALLACGCVPSPGPFVLPPVSGRVVDRETGAPIPGAEVVQAWRGGGVPGAARPELQARWTRSDGEGGFAFGRELARPALWLRKVYGPSFTFYHPDYGLVEAGAGASAAGATGGEAVELRGSLQEAPVRTGDLAVWCSAWRRGERPGAGARHLGEVACPERTPRSGP